MWGALIQFELLLGKNTLPSFTICPLTQFHLVGSCVLVGEMLALSLVGDRLVLLRHYIRAFRAFRFVHELDGSVPSYNIRVKLVFTKNLDDACRKMHAVIQTWNTHCRYHDV